MTILADYEIAELCHPDLEQPMLVPFVGEPTREVDGRKVISYGLTSYGYDARLSDQIKIFTNLNAGLIDPKRLSQKTLVDAEILTDDDGSRYAILPPNSYMLGVTIETFYMPRDAVSICLGKCLSGDTLISDTETGEIRKMKDTVSLKTVDSLNISNWTISKQKTFGLINNGILPMKKLVTRLGHEIVATGSHPFKTWTGWTALDELKPGVRVAVARRETLSGKTHLSPTEARLLGYMTADGQCSPHPSAESFCPVFTKTDEFVMNAFKKDCDDFGFVYSFRDPVSVRLVNKVGRGGRRPKNKAYEWLSKYGLNKLSREKTIPVAIQTGDRETIKNYLVALFTCDGSFYASSTGESAVIEYYSSSKELAQYVQILLRRLGLYFRIRHQVKKLNSEEYDIYILRLTSASELFRFDSVLGFLPGSKKDLLLKNRLKDFSISIKSNFDTLPSEAWADIRRIFKKHNKPMSSIGVFNESQSVPLNKLREISLGLGDSELTCLVNQDVIWDTVVSITDDIDQVAYDYTVPSYSNFVANGFIVHNSTMARSAAIVNVTPIEPGFVGQVVIEISNASSLPIKVYVDEGIAQFMFFRGNPCKISYADKGGKYQGQMSITLPFV